jgi:hypothetical protein
MVTLGSAFPPGFRQRHSGVIPGAVVHTRIVFPEDPRGRLKFVVVAHLQGNIAHCLLYNSEVHDLIQRNNALRRCQLEISNTVETYLPKVRSYLACHRLQRLSYGDLVDDVTENPACLVGRVTAETVGRIIGAVMVSPAISGELKESIKASLGPLA